MRWSLQDEKRKSGENLEVEEDMYICMQYIEYIIHYENELIVPGQEVHTLVSVY